MVGAFREKFGDGTLYCFSRWSVGLENWWSGQVQILTEAAMFIWQQMHGRQKGSGGIIFLMNVKNMQYIY